MPLTRAAYVPYQYGMMSSEEALLALSRVYASRTDAEGGRSLARIATIVVNRGSFFRALERGATCSVRNFDKLVAYFAEAANWPSAAIPPDAKDLLQNLGRSPSVGG